MAVNCQCSGERQWLGVCLGILEGDVDVREWKIYEKKMHLIDNRSKHVLVTGL